MANTLRNVGARLWGNPLRATVYQAGTGTVFAGDFVQLNSSGQVISWASSANTTLGVAAGYQATQGSDVLVWDHPDQQFVCQVDGTSVNGPLNTLFMNAQILANSGSNTFKVSRMQILGASIGTTTTFPLKVMGLDKRPDNAFGSSYADLIVLINNHVYKGGTGTLGV